MLVQNASIAMKRKLCVFKKVSESSSVKVKVLLPCFCVTAGRYCILFVFKFTTVEKPFVLQSVSSCQNLSTRERIALLRGRFSHRSSRYNLKGSLSQVKLFFGININSTQFIACSPVR